MTAELLEDALKQHIFRRQPEELGIRFINPQRKQNGESMKKYNRTYDGFPKKKCGEEEAP